MTLPAKSENVAVVRHAVAGLAETLGMEELGIGDLKTVVTEACMNVVVHAYDDEWPGPLQVEAIAEDEGLTVRVRDFGSGIRPRPDSGRQSLRIGLTLIAALSSNFEISGGLGRGTEIKMHLRLKQADPIGSVPPSPYRASAEAAELTLGSPDLIAPVLGRVIGALAARNRISVDRLSDAMLFTDAVSEGAPKAFTNGHFHFAVSDADEGVELRIGPLPQGAGERLRKEFSLPEIGGSLEALVDDIEVEEAGECEFVVVRFAAVTV
jgi:anti-sigma regulatory factor (Ser/Thr protein kinase)